MKPKITNSDDLKRFKNLLRSRNSENEVIFFLRNCKFDKDQLNKILSVCQNRKYADIVLKSKNEVK